MPKTRHAHAPLPQDSSLSEAIADYQLAARAEGLARKTVGERVGAATWLAVRTAMNRGVDAPITWADITKRHVQEHLAWLSEQYSSAYVSNQFRASQSWFRWLVAEDHIHVNPMVGLKPPTVPPKLVPVISDQDFSRLLDFSSSRNRWENIRGQIQGSSQRVGGRR